MKTLLWSFFWPFILYGLYLLLSGIQGLILGVIVLVICFLLFSIGFIGLFKSSFSLIGKQRIGASFLLLLVVTLTTVFLSVTNYVLDTSLSQSLSARVKHQYYMEAVLVEKERIFEKISFLKTLENRFDPLTSVFYEKQDEELAVAASRHFRKMQASNSRWIDAHNPVPVTVILYRNPLIFQKHLPHHSYENLQALYVPAEETIHLLVTKRWGPFFGVGRS
jgi:hypothetical protein